MGRNRRYPTLRIHQEGELSVTIMGILAEFLKQFVPRPLQLRSSKKYFMERFGPAFFMRPAYCTDCNKKPIKVKDADIVRHFLDGLNAEDPICPECSWVMNVSSWERFRAGFLDGTFTVEEFEKWERKTYMNEKFVSETLNQNS